MEFRIRKLRESEYSKTLALIRSLFPHHLVVVASDDHVLVATRGSHIIGFIHYCIAGTKGTIRGFGVEPSFRNRGIGKELLTRALTVLEKQVRSIYLKTTPDNPALSLYQGVGFISYQPSRQGKYVYLVRKSNN